MSRIIDYPADRATSTIHYVIDKTGNVIKQEVDAADRFWSRRMKADGYIVVNGMDEFDISKAELDKRLTALTTDIESRRAAHAAELDGQRKNKAVSKVEERAAEQLGRIVDAVANRQALPPQAPTPRKAG
jgi:hypothetical protein